MPIATFAVFRVTPGERVMADPVRLLKGLTTLKAKGIRYLCLTGGEPLLYPALVPVLAKARDLSIKTLVCTNGSLLTPASIQKLRARGS